MCPELNQTVAEELLKKAFKAKFVRSGTIVWVEEDRKISHLGVAMLAGFKDVDDAGQFSHSGNNKTIQILGSSRDFSKESKGPARDETIKVTQKIVGNSAKIVKE